MLRIKLTCPKHPRYDPDKSGEAGIVGACKICQRLFKVWIEANQVANLLYVERHTESEEEMI